MENVNGFERQDQPAAKPNVGTGAAPIPPTVRLVAFTDEQLEENDRFIYELVDLIATGQAVAVIGAGSSISAGYDSWRCLLQKLADRAAKLNPPLDPPLDRDAVLSSGREYLITAQRIRDHIVLHGGGRQGFHDAFGRVFVKSDDAIRRSLASFHEDLVHLPFRAFFTTNYDPVLELSFEQFRPEHGRPEGVAIWNGDRQKIGPAIRSLAVDGPIQFIVHLHGLQQLGQAIILCAEDYAEAYGLPELGPPRLKDDGPPPPKYDQPRHLFMLLSSLLSTRRCVFIGFSLDDLYFTEVLRRVADALWEWNSTVHFAVLPFIAEEAVIARQRAESLKSELGIQAVFYEVQGRDHGERDALIHRIREAVHRSRDLNRSPTLGATPSFSAPAIQPGSPPANHLAPGTEHRRAPEWVRVNNAAQRARLDRRAQ